MYSGPQVSQQKFDVNTAQLKKKDLLSVAKKL